MGVHVIVIEAQVMLARDSGAGIPLVFMFQHFYSVVFNFCWHIIPYSPAEGSILLSRCKTLAYELVSDTASETRPI